jgi:hypothetical protein
MKSKQPANFPSGSGSSSAFFKPKYRRSLAFVGTTGLVFGLGLSGLTSAQAGEAEDCDVDTIVSPSDTPSANVLAIQAKLTENDGIVCLLGDFVINDALYFYRDSVVYGIGSSSISAPDSLNGVFVSDGPGTPDWDIEIRNLTVKDSANLAVWANNVIVGDRSIFSGNRNGAIFAYGVVEVSNSTFLENENGAIGAEGSVEVSNSLFVNNFGRMSGSAIVSASQQDSVFVPGSETNFDISITNSTFEGNEALAGGAVQGHNVNIENSTFLDNKGIVGGAINSYGVQVVNSTFLGNEVAGEEAEGGAIYSIHGAVAFSTFVNNVAPQPPVGGDVPGNAIFKEGSGYFLIAANIFAGNPEYPQLGFGNVEPSQFDDVGTNVFSTSPATETDVSQHQDSVFGASLVSIFGTNAPSLATYAPNTNGTQSIALAPGSPALDIVDISEPSPEVLFDQRGVVRTHPADAGAFEGVAPVSPTPTVTATVALAKTGNSSPLWFALASALFLALGSFALLAGSKLRRRNI